MKDPRPFLFVAVHQGPYLSIQPIEPELGARQAFYLVEGVARQERGRKGMPSLDLGQVQREWGNLREFLRKSRVAAVIRSTSEDVPGINVEDLASASAWEAGVPLFVVEDFPGNYWPKSREKLAGLFVEDESLVQLHQSRGTDPRVIHCTGNPRYSALGALDTAKLRSEVRRALGLADERAVLWAGQPDGDNSYHTLARLLERFDRSQVTLLFRAHPRDQSYGAGKYAGLLSRTSMKVLDVSRHPDGLGLYCASDLVVTQFSSAGVEASYLGTPAMFVLFDDLGKQALRSLKGYDTLPWCTEGCSFLVEGVEEVARAMEEALFNASAREQVRSNFRRRFGAGRDSAKVIARRIREIVGEV
jgi:hypothetical protein